MAPSGVFSYIGGVSKLPSRLATVLLLVFCSAFTAPVALAQDESLPDPNKQSDSGKKSGSNLPKTGLPAAVLLLAGSALLSSGAVIRPAKRVKREYDSDEWHRRVNPERYGRSEWL